MSTFINNTHHNHHHHNNDGHFEAEAAAVVTANGIAASLSNNTINTIALTTMSSSSTTAAASSVPPVVQVQDSNCLMNAIEVQQQSAAATATAPTTTVLALEASINEISASPLLSHQAADVAPLTPTHLPPAVPSTPTTSAAAVTTVTTAATAVSSQRMSRHIVGGQRALSYDSNSSVGVWDMNRINGDTLMLIMRYLDVTSLALFASRVNRHWYRISSHDSLWAELILLRWPELAPPPAAEPHPESVDPFENLETRRKSRAASLSSHLFADSTPSLLSLVLQHYIRVDGGSVASSSAAGGMYTRSTSSIASHLQHPVTAANLARQQSPNRGICMTHCCCSGWCGGSQASQLTGGTTTRNGIASVTATPSRGSGNNMMRGIRNARWWYARWVKGDDIFGPSRIAYDYEFRQQPLMPQLDKGRHFIIEGRLTFEQESCAIISLTSGRVHTMMPVQCLPTPLVRPELRWEPYRHAENEWEARQREGYRKISMFVHVPISAAVAITTLMSSVHGDGVSFGSHSWTLSLLPIMLAVATCIPYIGWYRNQYRTVDELIATLIGAVGLLGQVIAFALRLDRDITSSYTIVLLPVFVLFAFAVLVGIWHGYSATRLMLYGRPHASCCYCLSYALRYILAYVVVFGPFAAFVYMAARCGDGSLSVSWYAIMAPLFPYELVLVFKAFAKCDSAAYSLYQSHDLTRYVKQVDLRWLLITRLRWLLVPVLIVTAQVLLPLRLDGYVSWSYTATCIPIMIACIITSFGEYWRWYGNRTKILFVREPVMSFNTNEQTLPPSKLITLTCC